MNFIIHVLCLAVAIKLCVILAHEDYICIDNPECFTLLLKQQQHLGEAVKLQLDTQNRMLHLQEEQLKVLAEMKNSITSSASVKDTLLKALLSNFIYLLVLGCIISVLPWLFRKYTELAKRKREDYLNHELTTAIMQCLRSHVHGSGLDHSEQCVEVRTETIPLIETRMDSGGILRQTDDCATAQSTV